MSSAAKMNGDEPILERYVHVVKGIGAGYHPDTPARDYANAVELMERLGMTWDEIDDASTDVAAEGYDPYQIALDVLNHAHGAADCNLHESECDHTTTEDGEGGTLPDGQTQPMVCWLCGSPAHYTDQGGYRHDEDGSPAGPDTHGCGWRRAA